MRFSSSLYSVRRGRGSRGCVTAQRGSALRHENIHTGYNALSSLSRAWISAKVRPIGGRLLAPKPPFPPKPPRPPPLPPPRPPLDMMLPAAESVDETRRSVKQGNLTKSRVWTQAVPQGWKNVGIFQSPIVSPNSNRIERIEYIRAPTKGYIWRLRLASVRLSPCLLPPSPTPTRATSAPPPTRFTTRIRPLLTFGLP